MHCIMCGEVEDCHILCGQYFIVLALYSCESCGSSFMPPARSVDSIPAQCMKWIFNAEEHTVFCGGLGGDIT